MKTLFRNILPILAAAFVLSACGDDFKPSAYGEDDGVAPAQVKDVVVENINGGAILRYTVPSDPDLLYVKAVLQNSRNERQEVRASMYVDSLLIEGLGNTQSRKVEIYSVDRHENASKPVTVTINPLTPAVEAVYSTISTIADFGGFVLSFANETRAALSFYIYKFDEAENDYLLHDVVTSEQESASLRIKGFGAALQRLAITVRDKYDNKSETYYTELTPYHQELLDKTKFASLNLLGDTSWNAHGGNIAMLWDGVSRDAWGWNYGHVQLPTDFPHLFSIDMGVTAKLSEFTFYQRQGGDWTQYYDHGCPKYISVYGCEEDADYRDDANWILLYEGEVVRPSGLKPGDALTEEDSEAVQNGHTYTLDITAPSVRYFRFVTHASFSGMLCSVMSEISVWGAPEAEEVPEAPEVDDETPEDAE